MLYDNWYKVHGDSCEQIIEVDDEQNLLQTLIKTDIHENIIKAIKYFPESGNVVLVLSYQENLNLKDIDSC